MTKFLKLVGAVAVSEGVGLLGSVVTLPAIGGWYRALNKPAFTPPNWVFGPVWTVLYLLMGIALYLVVKKGARPPRVKLALLVFGIQLGLNCLWSFIFFGMHLPWLALGEIAVLWSAVMLTIWAFEKVSKSAAYLLLPYILWISFAAILNYSIAILN